MRNRLIRYFDSMSGNNTSGMEALKLYLADEHIDKKKTELNMETWSIIHEVWLFMGIVVYFCGVTVDEKLILGFGSRAIRYFW